MRFRLLFVLLILFCPARRRYTPFDIVILMFFHAATPPDTAAGMIQL